MTQLLVSVQNLEEALLALRAGADIIDMKDPHHGALGALPVDVIADIVTAIDGRVPTSATVGDWNGDLAYLLRKMEATAAVGVTYIKIEYHEALTSQTWLHALREQNCLAPKLIVMFLVDKLFEPGLMLKMRQLGFSGVMLDTEGKQHKNLLDYHTSGMLEKYALQLKDKGMLCGFAGSLKDYHAEQLANIGADFLGYRGGLCLQENRRNSLSESKILTVKNMLRKNNIHLLTNVKSIEKSIDLACMLK